MNELKNNEDYQNFLELLTREEEFSIFFKELQDYAQKVIDYWEMNKAYTEKYMKEVLKTDIDISLIVYISHPYIREGRSFQNGIIAFGHYDGLEDPDYNYIYIFHESMHEVMPNDYIKWTKEQIDINHEVIELTSDYELYSRRTKQSKFTQGHPRLKEIRKQIYPYWLLYLGLTEDEIKQRMDFDNNHFDIEAYIEYKEDLSDMNIYEFRDFCFEHIKVDEKDKSEGQK